MPAPTPPISPQDASDEANAASIALMQRVKAGDQGAFAELVRLHQQAVIGSAARMLGNLDDAHDIAQQVFIRIWKSAPRYEPSAKFTTWMFTILRNLVFNEHRRRDRHPAESLDANAEEYGTQLADGGMSPDASAREKELREAIDAAIQALPEAQRMAVILRRYEDLPYEEIATVMDMSLSAVKSLLFRARSELRDRLRQFLDAD
jgi:RNA polymerase sigma-70 factor (ECF subfamily)